MAAALERVVRARRSTDYRRGPAIADAVGQVTILIGFIMFIVYARP